MMLLDYIPQSINLLDFSGFRVCFIGCRCGFFIGCSLASLLVVAVDSFSVVASFLRIPLKYRSMA